MTRRRLPPGVEALAFGPDGDRLLRAVATCADRGGVVPHTRTAGCACPELTECRAGRGESPHGATLDECLACRATPFLSSAAPEPLRRRPTVKYADLIDAEDAAGAAKGAADEAAAKALADQTAKAAAEHQTHSDLGAALDKLPNKDGVSVVKPDGSVLVYAPTGGGGFVVRTPVPADADVPA